MSDAVKTQPAATPEARPEPRLKIRYRDEIVPALVKEFNYRNVMQVPRITRRFRSTSALAKRCRTARRWKRRQAIWRS
jgi:hypothetical protein